MQTWLHRWLIPLLPALMPKFTKRGTAELRWTITDLAAWRRDGDESRIRRTCVSWRMRDASMSLVLLRRTGGPLYFFRFLLRLENSSRPPPPRGTSATYCAP